jgi:hypothetical protein
MELLGEVGHVESCFGPFGDGVSVSAREVHGLRKTYLCFKYTYDKFNVESCSDTLCHGTVQIIRAQVQKQS